MEAGGERLVPNQFANPDHPGGHVATTGPEIWEQTGGDMMHSIAFMGTTETVMGVSRFLKSQNPDI